MSLTSLENEIDLESTLGSPPESKRGEFTWELVSMFPRQGEWTEQQYLSIDTNQLVEFADGMLEFLPMVTPLHQDLVSHLREHLERATRGRYPGRVYVAPLRVRLANGKYREPDVIFAKPEHVPDRRKPLIGANLVMEVVSGSAADRHRDFVTKRDDYASSAIAEYWIVDSDLELVTVLTLPSGQDHYEVHGEFRRGDIASSVLLPELMINVAECFDEGISPSP